MSAIVGYWAGSDARPPEPACRTMLATLSAYGPHAQDVGRYDGVALGRALYRQLPEDLHDRQPLAGAGGRLALVADVRLDNRDELLAALGRSMATGVNLSDADILLVAYERWGENLVDHVDGDFAFAIWDAHARRLIMARDPQGQRPLYYHSAPGFFAFASMPKGLHALSGIERRPDMSRLADFVGLVPLTGDRSFYDGVKRVEPGHVVTVDGSGIRSRRYWNPALEVLRLATFDAYRDAFRAEIDRAVRVRLRRSGGEVATHLSAGWDSGTVTATAARLLTPDGLRAYTSVPRAGSASGALRNDVGDEGALAAQTAALHPNVAHVRLAGTGRSPIADLDFYVSAFDRPLYNLANQLWAGDIRKNARAHGASVLLTGEQGNWTISAAPYTLLADYLREGRWFDWLAEARALASTRSARLRGIAATSFGPWVPSSVWKLVRPLSSRPEAAGSSAIHPDLAREIERKREAGAVGLARRPKNHRLEVATGLLQYDFGDSRKGALAGWGIDERDPTADRRLIEFCLSLPIDMLLKNGVRRPLARAALADRLPAAVMDEKRKGYQAADWHEGLTAARPEMAALIEEMAANDLAASLIDIASLRRWVNDWPEAGWSKPVVMDRYRRALPIALTAGHFILHCART